MELMTGVTVMGVISMVMNGLPVEATQIRSSQSGCELVAKAARAWRTPTRAVSETTIGRWCSVGTVADGYWVSEQWDRAMHQGWSRGWRVRIPVAAIRAASSQHSTRFAVAATNVWGLNLLDSTLGTGIRFRQSSQGLDLHHQRTLLLASPARWGTGLPGVEPAISRTSHPLRLSRMANGTLILSGRDPSGGSYSVLIDRSSP